MVVCWLEQLVGCSCVPPGDYLNARIPQDPCCQSETADLGKAWEMCVCVYVCTCSCGRTHLGANSVFVRHFSPLVSTLSLETGILTGLVALE